MATSYAQDDGFREIQLNGKQLFFLFMATTVVSVVIFLCGVLVGRGVRAERVAIADATVDQAPTSDVAPVAAPAQSVASDPIAATAPPLPQDDEIRPAELKITANPGAKADAKPADAKPADAKPTEAKSKEAKPAVAPAAPKAAPVENAEARPAPKPEPPAAKPGATGEAQFVVQVAAVKTRGEADSLVKKVTASGYPAFISESTAGMFRVRVGPFKIRRDAEAAADKLKRQQGAADPWITTQ